ncbi:MAG: hypothetical protein ACOX6Q_01420 [Candidatus Dojkabacteria bacterium]|jgi:hypothetical protein
MKNILPELVNKETKTVTNRFKGFSRPLLGYDIGNGKVLYNLTGSPVEVVFANNARTVEASCYIANIRMRENRNVDTHHIGTLLAHSVEHYVKDLPAEDGTSLFIVSRDVFLFCKERKDLLTFSERQGDRITDSEDNLIGSLSLQGRFLNE